MFRTAGGAVAIDIPVSPWLYVCTMLLALFIGFGKRRHELTSLTSVAGRHRSSLDAHSVELLDQLLSVVAAATIVAYSFHTFGASAASTNHAMMLTIPFVVYAIFRYLFLIPDPSPRPGWQPGAPALLRPAAASNDRQLGHQCVVSFYLT